MENRKIRITRRFGTFNSQIYVKKKKIFNGLLLDKVSQKSAM